MPYDTLGFALSNRCTASCRHCCFSCSPFCDCKLNTSRVVQYIEESANIPQIKNIAFTGGEAFLFYDELTDLITISKASGKKTSVATNGFWAGNYIDTYAMLKKLKDNGLNHISVSYDDYHREYVKSDNIRNILRASFNMELSVSLAIVKLKDEKIGGLLDDLGCDVYPASIKIGACLPAGVASQNFANDSFDRTMDISNARCTYGGSISVMFDGKIYPCCSQVIRDTALCIGNFYDISLSDALYKAKNNALLYFLRNKPMSFFTHYASKTWGEAYPSKIVNPCELCAMMFSPAHMQLFHEYIMNNAEKVKNNEV